MPIHHGSPLPPKLNINILLRKPPRLTPQQILQLGPTHPHLLPHRHQPLRQQLIVLPDQVEGYEVVVDVLEDEGAFGAVLVLLGD